MKNIFKFNKAIHLLLFFTIISFSGIVAQKEVPSKNAVGSENTLGKWVAQGEKFLNRQAVSLSGEKKDEFPSANRGFLWDSDDSKTKKFRPQGIAGLKDGGKEYICVSWYGRQEEGSKLQVVEDDIDYRKRGARISIVELSSLKYRHILLVDKDKKTYYDKDVDTSKDAHAGVMHAGGIAVLNGKLHVADSRSGQGVIRVFDFNKIKELPETEAIHDYRFILMEEYNYKAPMKPSFISYDKDLGKILIGTFEERALLKRFLQASQFNVLAEVTSGEAVLDFLKYSSPVPDILFLDYKMEPGNAVEIIKTIKPQYPAIMIVIVTGNTNKDVITELIKLKISSYILKPINKNTLDDKLIQLLGRKDLVLQSKLATKKHAVKLEELNVPPLPSVAHKVLLFEGDTVSGSSELEQIILPDKSICADILRMANSAYYARAKKIQTIKDAITLLGLKTIKNIVMLQSKKYIGRNLVYSDVFKKHLLEYPILTALVALDISAPLGLKSLREELFLSAMMCKIGMTILALHNSSHYTEILTQYQNTPSDLAKFEKDEFDVNHIDVGFYIFKIWQMPPVFLKMMKNQGFEPNNYNSVDDFDRILRVADIISKRLLHIPILETELDLAKTIIKHYKAPEDTIDVFGEDYYNDIKSHPFFESI
ncbi:MAG: HDOD domain-containing protein [Leptospiraceae bacterium]|nr:HDOD domain-containing protein [Leptospiraceae bacterium]